MNNRTFGIAIAVLILITIGFIASTASKNKPLPRSGIAQVEAADARKHVAATANPDYHTAIPTSGPHANEANWGNSATQLPNVQIIHNMEHGGIIVSYRPNIDPATKQKLISLFTKPYANPKFNPTKAIVMPRADQKEPIVLASWERTESFASFDRAKLENYYLTNIGKSPEPRGI